MRKLLRITALCLLLAMTLSGCGTNFVDFDLQLTLSPQELYTLPKLPAKYTALNDQIDAIISGGAEYAAPMAGTNIQPVQLRDLDGDGKEEALAFLRMCSALAVTVVSPLALTLREPRSLILPLPVLPVSASPSGVAPT